MLSIIIPTLQNNIKVLNKLLIELIDDECVNEVIVIDNSRRGISLTNKKIKVLTPKVNLYVNPAWNLGVRCSKNQFIGILNDDLILPKGFLSKICLFMEKSRNIGFIGIDKIEKSSPEKFINYPVLKKISFKKIKERNLSWGIAIFFKKQLV